MKLFVIFLLSSVGFGLYILSGSMGPFIPSLNISLVHLFYVKFNYFFKINAKGIFGMSYQYVNWDNIFALTSGLSFCFAFMSPLFILKKKLIYFLFAQFRTSFDVILTHQIL